MIESLLTLVHPVVFPLTPSDTVSSFEMSLRKSTANIETVEREVFKMTHNFIYFLCVAADILAANISKCQQIKQNYTRSQRISRNMLIDNYLAVSFKDYTEFII